MQQDIKFEPPTLKEIQQSKEDLQIEANYKQFSIEHKIEQEIKADKYYLLAELLHDLGSGREFFIKCIKRPPENSYKGQSYLVPICECGNERATFTGLNTELKPLFICKQCNSARIITNIRGEKDEN